MSAIAIGYNAGMSGQNETAIAIGYNAGMMSGQNETAIAIGYNAGMSGQNASGIAIGYNAGMSGQNASGIAIGYNAGMMSGQRQNASGIAIGYCAGISGQRMICNHVKGDYATIDKLNEQYYGKPLDYYSKTVQLQNSNKTELHRSTLKTVCKYFNDDGALPTVGYQYYAHELGVMCKHCNRVFIEYNEPRIIARNTLLKPDIMEAYARKTMNPCHLQKLLDDPDQDVDIFMENYIKEL